MNDILLPHIRAVNEETDRGLPKFSYSKIEQFLNCPMAYNYKYNQEMKSLDTSLALELGSLLHACLEAKGHMLLEQNEIDYEYLDKLIYNGIIETDEKTRQPLLGITELKTKYWETWNELDSEGKTYVDKLKIFHKVIYTEMEDDDWIPYGFEVPFQFVWDNKYILHGFIDRIDIKNGEYRVIDYKTSKKEYDNSKLPTSLQFGIYALACMVLFGKKPVECKYRFILLDKTQKALTLGWEKRLLKKITDVFVKIEERNSSNLWEPKPSPLCYYCNYSSTNPNAKEYKTICDYYCLWSPSNKTFEKNKTWNINDTTTDKQETKRTLIF
jgi:RecB family exonuclease